jgi:hypothetical protein
MCGLSGLPTLNETIDDVLIFASVRPIDGVGGLLAQAGPCAFRTAPAGGLGLTAIGVMEFDSADLAAMQANGTLQEVITHEMLHVLGIGTMWQGRSLLTGLSTSNVVYTGASGAQGCRDSGGSIACALTVPVESSGGSGTINSHWRETTFRNEMMTGYADVGGMPLSALTVGGLADLGYAVNMYASDPYIMWTSTAAGATTAATISEPWERRLGGTGGTLPPP